MSGISIAGDLSILLDEAIGRLQAGTPLAQCLAMLPPAAAQALAPLLAFTALAAERAATPAPALVKARVRSKIMAAAESRLAPRPAFDFALPSLRPLGLAAAAASAVLALGGSGAVVASASALPGDSLYPVKLAVEDARRSIAESSGDAAAQAALQAELAQRRLEEAQALAAGNRPVPPALIEAAEKHERAAEEAAALVPEPKRGQIAATLDRSESRRTEVLSGLLNSRELPLPAQTAVAKALEHGRAARTASPATPQPTATPLVSGPAAVAASDRRDEQEERHADQAEAQAEKHEERTAGRLEHEQELQERGDERRDDRSDDRQSSSNSGPVSAGGSNSGAGNSGNAPGNSGNAAGNPGRSGSANEAPPASRPNPPGAVNGSSGPGHSGNAAGTPGTPGTSGSAGGPNASSGPGNAGRENQRALQQGNSGSSSRSSRADNDGPGQGRSGP